MRENNGIERLRRESYREVNRDGLTELAAGVALFIVALAVGRPAFYWTYLALIVILGPGLNRLRGRFTYPRIGFVELAPEDRSRLGRGMIAWFIGTFVLVALGLFLLGGFTDRLAWRRAAPALGGLLLAGGLLYLAGRTGLKRIYALAAASVATGLLMASVLVDGAYGNLRVWALIMALLCLAVGGLAFRRFVRDTPVLDEWGHDAG